MVILMRYLTLALDWLFDWRDWVLRGIAVMPLVVYAVYAGATGWTEWLPLYVAAVAFSGLDGWARRQARRTRR